MSRLPSSLLLAGLLLCAACSPTYNWREVRDDKAAYTVLLPAKASTHARQIDLGGVKVEMTMTAAEVEGVVFAVGSAALPPGAQPPQALAAMRTALVRNLAGRVAAERPVQAGAVAGTELDLRGTRTRAGQSVPTRMQARLYAHQGRVYQVLVMGDEKAVDAEAMTTFLASFKPQ